MNENIIRKVSIDLVKDQTTLELHVLKKKL